MLRVLLALGLAFSFMADFINPANLVKAQDMPSTTIGYASRPKTELSYNQRKTSASATLASIRFDVPYNDYYFNGGRIDIMMSKNMGFISTSLIAGLKKNLGFGLSIHGLTLAGIQSGGGDISAWLLDERKTQNSQIEDGFFNPKTGGLGLLYGVEAGVSYQINKWLALFVSQNFMIAEIFQKYVGTTVNHEFQKIDHERKKLYHYRITTQPLLFGVQSALF